MPLTDPEESVASQTALSSSQSAMTFQDLRDKRVSYFSASALRDPLNMFKDV